MKDNCGSPIGKTKDLRGGGPGRMFLAALAVPHGGAKCTSIMQSKFNNVSNTFRWLRFVMSIRKIATPLGSNVIDRNHLKTSRLDKFARPQNTLTQTAFVRGSCVVAPLRHFLLQSPTACLSPHLMHSCQEL